MSPLMFALRFPLLLLALGLGFAAPAAAGSDARGRCELGAADGGSWRPVFERVCAAGRYTPADGMIPETLGLEKQSAPRDVSHDSDYANLWGWRGGDDLFRPTHATLVSERWTLQGERWHIDQWIVTLRLDGTPRQIRHGGMVQDLHGRVLEDWTDQAPDSDPKYEAKLAALRSLWSR